MGMETQAHADFVTERKSSSTAGTIYTSLRLKCWSRITAARHSAADYIAPFGYEDETGFHYGEPPQSKVNFKDVDKNQTHLQ
jgi:hypothetical protein